jgi:ATP-dependent RNA helicase DDX47/RRP3
VINKKMDLWPTDKEEIALLRERVDEAGRLAATELREEGGKGYRRRRKGEGEDKDVRDRDDDVVQAGMPTKKKKSRR